MLQGVKQLGILIYDFFAYPWVLDKQSNKFQRLMDFLFKEYPAFLGEKFHIKKLLMLPWLVWYVITKEEDFSQSSK